jgi:cob(I)alamin adenosyltransferase
MKSIKDANIISTKKGDKGYSKNYSNESFKKTDVLFDVIGSIDELSSLLGVTYHYIDFKLAIKEIQKHLQDIMSVIATNPESDNYKKLNMITEKQIHYLEFLEQDILKETEIKPVFVLPGSESTQGSAYLDLSRSVTRRVERYLNRFTATYNRVDLDTSKAYLNRLSDLLYIMARSND